MDILVVTGRLAENAVKRSVQNEADVLVLDIEVASFITPALLRRYFPSKKYDLILIPGLASGDFSGLEKEFNTQIRLGPKHAVDLGFVLSYSGEVAFSSKVPACELLLEKRRANALERTAELEESAASSLFLKGVKLGGSSRMKVMAEVVDAAHLPQQELTDKIVYFVQQGADIIDLGMAMDTEPDEARAAVEIAKSATNLPLSIDTLEPSLINAALDAGIDIVLSLNSENINEIKDKIVENSAVAVIIPDCVEDIESLFTNIEAAKDAGINSIIADPVLEPPGQGFVDSLNRYYEFRKRDKATPLFFGAGNVTELVDADSIGINALLAGIAVELEACILFTPEYSDKAHGSVTELKTASVMMALARDRGSPPKDLGIDILVAREKRRRPFGNMPEAPVEAKGSEKWHLDPAGSFKIDITDDEIHEGKLVPGKIIARNRTNSIAGDRAKDVIDTIIRLGLVSRLDHAAYLGRELMKAELALKLRRSYSQDDEF
ncbi:MAG: dihydropteroate synthase-like protein [Candidatus Methanoperedens sp.]|nr:dihydropteroate synthase-like protein [Candidatus Methanoperedens sp.]